MPYMKIMDKNIYYREHGSGEVVVFLNGVMMSTASWSPFIKVFSREYKMVLVDLIDQGRSDSANKQYSQDENVEILKELLESLGYEKIHLVGVSYGGQIAQLFTLKYGHMVKSLILSNTSCHTNDNMIELKKLWDWAASTYDASIFCSTFLSGIYSSKYYEENNEMFKKMEEQLSKHFDEEWYERIRRVVSSGYNFDISNRIVEINKPTMIISSELDVITPPECQKELYEKIPKSRWVVIEDAGHGCIYEKPYEFISIVLGFLKNASYNIKVKP